ncbi:Oxysterol-binding protein 2 [Geodia barretti]|uniref:Oxysterol-binding protein 2 n=1 Tax=Geodia barretti TaxID=519541 RepID=A0AA35S155_GEOBA|nr:Oxysterol-binding protein 2 [Geodia barretti]
MNDFSTRQLENQCRVSPTVTALVMTLRLVRSAVISTGSPRSLLSAIIQKRARVFCTLTSTSLAYPEHFRGWLLKWTNYIKGYWKRWFVLSNGLLSYYSDDEAVRLIQMEPPQKKTSGPVITEEGTTQTLVLSGPPDDQLDDENDPFTSTNTEMFLADDYELQGLCKGHCPFCRTSIDSL